MLNLRGGGAGGIKLGASLNLQKKKLPYYPFQVKLILRKNIFYIKMGTQKPILLLD
jgi:hypothetical protein